MTTETRPVPAAGGEKPPVDGGVFIEKQQKPERRRPGKKTVAALSIVAVGLTAGVLALRPKGDDEPRVQTPVPTLSGPNAGPGPEPAVTQTGEAPGASQTPNSGSTPEQPTVSDVIESLTVPLSAYDPELVQKLEINEQDLDRINTHFADLYPSIATDFRAEASDMEVGLQLLKAEDIIRAQKRFNAMLAAPTYTDESLEDGDPKEISLGGYLSSGKYATETPFPSPPMTPEAIKEIQAQYANMTLAEYPKELRMPSYFIQTVNDSGMMYAPLVWEVGHERNIATYNQSLPEEDKSKMAIPAANALELFNASFVYEPNRQDANTMLQYASNPNNSLPGCGEGFIVRARSYEMAYGSKTLNVNAMIVACDQPQANRFALRSFVMIPVDSYFQGKKTNTQVLRPFPLGAHDFAGISK